MTIMMKGRLPEPFLFLILLLIIHTVSGLGSVLVRSYMQIQNYYTWQDAQTFCRSSLDYTDLAIIYKQSDTDSLDLQEYYAWIGAYKQLTPNFNWIWSNGENVDLWLWAANQPDSGDGCANIRYNENLFYGTECGEYYFFICNIKNHDDKYTFINQSMTWSDAQQYCKQFYNYLAVTKNYGQLNSAVQVQQDFPVWIGLYRDGDTWKWSAGVSDYRNWAPNEPGNSNDCVAISSMSKTMTTQNCSARYPFICCKDNLVLVKENKTWEEALEYCKSFTSQSNSLHLLVSVQPGDDHSYMMDRVMEADTDEVWTGLRFLAGNWIWVNGADMSLSDLPLCPLSGQYCGAFSKNDTGSLETRDCLEKKNFLCYSLW